MRAALQIPNRTVDLMPGQRIGNITASSARPRSPPRCPHGPDGERCRHAVGEEERLRASIAKKTSRPNSPIASFRGERRCSGGNRRQIP